MLTIEMSTNKDALRESMLRNIQKIDSSLEGAKVFVLVPEQETFAVNRELCAKVGVSTRNSIEVMGFERMMRMVYRDCGHRKTHLDDGGRLIAMSQAAAACRRDMSVFGRSAMQPEFYKTLLATYSSMKLNGIGLDMLKPGEETTKDMPKLLVEKLNDLHRIFSEYEGICETTTCDPADELTRVAEIMLDGGWAKNTIWFVEGFSDFPKQQMDLLAMLIKDAGVTDITVGLLAKNKFDKHPGRELAAQTAMKLGDIATERGCRWVFPRSVHEKEIPDALVALQDILCDVAPVTKALEDKQGAVRFSCDASVYQECQHIAGDILRAVRDGHRFKDISVALCDYDRYAPVMDTVCRRYRIPAYFSSDKIEIAKNPVMTSVFSALEAATRGMPLEMVLQYMKSGLNNLSIEETDALETYTRVWNIHGRGWEPEAGWTMNPSGYGVDMSPDDETALAYINGLREKGISPLVMLKNDMSAAKTVSEYIMALYNFLERTQFTEKVQGMIDDLSNQGDRQTAMQFAQVNEVLNHAMEQMYDTLGSAERTAQDFVKMLKLICSAYKIATIPATLDQVEITNMQDARFVTGDIRFIAGCEEGVFPTYAVEAGLFDSFEVDALNKAEINIPGGIHDATVRSLAEVQSVITGVRKRLTLSYAQDMAAQSTPSHLYLRARKLFPETPELHGCDESGIYEADLLDAEMAGRLVARISTRHAYDDTVGSLVLVENPALQQTANRIWDKARWKLGDLDRRSVRGLYGTRIPLTATRADVYAACRYHYFLKYGLALRERPHGKSDAPAFGRFAHYVLEHAMREIEHVHGGFKAVSHTQMEDITRKYISAYTEERMKGLEAQPERYAYLYKRHCRELVQIMANCYNELKDADFHCSAFELKIGGEGADVPGVAIEGEKFKGMYTGIADRVDMCDVNGTTYVRVVDYKTGKSKSFDPTDILCGLSMQILMEQAALREVGYTPKGGQAGVLYVPAKNPVIALPAKTSDEKVIAEYEKMTTRHGMLINDPVVLNAMEPLEAGRAHYIPVKVGADGSMSGDLCSVAQMESLNTFTKKTMSSMVDGIGSGVIHANPISRGPERTACTYCPMCSACHKDADGVKFRYRKKVEMDEFWAEIAEPEETC